MPAASGEIARSVLDARRGRRRLQPFSTRYADFTPSVAYAAAAELRRLRENAGETPVGRKIGFTNRNIWPEYGVYGPIWGEMYDSTVIDVAPCAAIDISHLSQPRLEPEIILGIGQDLHAGMSLAEMESAVAWVAHGFEVVQTVFPDWKFTAADCIAEGGLHGLLLLGPRKSLDAQDRIGLADRLAAIDLELLRDGEIVGRGVGVNVLDGPVHALKVMVDGLTAEPSCQPVQAGECITTGTLTRAFPIEAGQRWSTRLAGYDLPGLDVTFR